MLPEYEIAFTPMREKRHYIGGEHVEAAALNRNNQNVWARPAGAKPQGRFRVVERVLAGWHFQPHITGELHPQDFDGKFLHGDRLIKREELFHPQDFDVASKVRYVVHSDIEKNQCQHCATKGYEGISTPQPGGEVLSAEPDADESHESNLCGENQRYGANR